MIDQRCNMKFLHRAGPVGSMSVHGRYLSSHREVSASQALKEDVRYLQKAGCRINKWTEKKTVHFGGLVGFLATKLRHLERAKGFEPSTSCLGSRHSTAELRPHLLLLYAPRVNGVKSPLPQPTHRIKHPHCQEQQHVYIHRQHIPPKPLP